MVRVCVRLFSMSECHKNHTREPAWDEYLRSLDSNNWMDATIFDAQKKPSRKIWLNISNPRKNEASSEAKAKAKNRQIPSEKETKRHLEGN